MNKGKFRLTNDVATKPLAGTSMTIINFIGDTSKFSMLTQSCDMNKFVAPVSMIEIKGIPFIKHVPYISLSDL